MLLLLFPSYSAKGYVKTPARRAFKPVFWKTRHSGYVAFGLSASYCEELHQSSSQGSGACWEKGNILRAVKVQHLFLLKTCNAQRFCQMLLHWLKNRWVHSVLFPHYVQIKGKNWTRNFYQLLSESCGNLPASWLVDYYEQMKNWRNSTDLCVLFGWSPAFYWPWGFHFSRNHSISWVCMDLKYLSRESDFRDLENKAQKGRFPCTGVHHRLGTGLGTASRLLLPPGSHCIPLFPAQQ